MSVLSSFLRCTRPIRVLRTPPRRGAIVPALLLVVAVLAGCAASHHATEPATLGRPGSSDAMLAALGAPGPIVLETVVAADWAVPLGGLVNLDHPVAKAAGLEDRDEPIQIYLHVLRHPTHGTFVVDSGVEAGFRDPAQNPRVGYLVRKAMDTDRLVVHETTGEWLARNGGRLDGVFLTHLHLDHIMGLPDVPSAVPVYAGPGETDASGFLNLFSRGTTDALLDGAGPLRVWQFAPDPDGRFEGLLDVFGDGSLWAIHAPGHTPGSTAFAVATTEGPVLLLGDTCHTRWGWEHGVEPGTFSLDGPRSAASLARLRAFAAQIPDVRAHPGHQSPAPSTESPLADRR